MVLCLCVAAFLENARKSLWMARLLQHAQQKRRPAVSTAFLGAHQPPHAASSVEHLLHAGQAHGWRDQIQGKRTQSLTAAGFLVKTTTK